MIDLILSTDTPSAVVKFLKDRGICKDGDTGGIVGVKGGFEYTANEVPNPFVTSGTGTEKDPYVYDTLKVYLLRLSGDTEADDIKDQQGADSFLKSKLAGFAKANGTQVTLNSANGWSATAWRVQVNGARVFLARADDNPYLPKWQE